MSDMLDLGVFQRATITQLQQDQQRLTELDTEREQLVARIHASRGKLDLLAEMASHLQHSEAIPSG